LAAVGVDAASSSRGETWVTLYGRMVKKAGHERTASGRESIGMNPVPLAASFAYPLLGSIGTAGS
jgi:hypothetical protein